MFRLCKTLKYQRYQPIIIGVLGALALQGCDLLTQVTPPPALMPVEDQREDLATMPDMSQSTDQPKDQPLDLDHGMKDQGAPLPWRSLLRINTGSDKPLTLDGDRWEADRDWVGPRRTSTRAASEIEGTSLDPLFFTEAFRADGYAIPVEDGVYLVRLHFAETWDGVNGPGQRVFDVTIEDQRISALDVFALTGSLNHALVQELKVTVKDQWIDIKLEATQLNTVINAIEVLTQRGELRALPKLGAHERALPATCGQLHTINGTMTATQQAEVIDLMMPGDTLELEDGYYEALELTLPQTHIASAGCPTQVRAKSALGARINAQKTTIKLDGAHIIVSGLNLINPTTAAKDHPLVSLGQGPGVRLSHSTFTDSTCTSAAPQQGFAIHIEPGAIDARVDHNTFERLCGGAIWARTSGVPALRPRLDHNTFDEPLSDQAMILLGEPDQAPKELGALIEHNLFDWGSRPDAAMIMGHSAKDTISHNIFRRIDGPSVSLRSSEQTTLLGNVFDRAGSVEVGGADHTLVSNLFINSEELTLSAGHSTNALEPSAQRVLIAHNTFWDMRGGAIALGDKIGAGRSVPARDVVMLNNVFYAGPNAAAVNLVELQRDGQGKLGVDIETITSACHSAQLSDPSEHRVGWPLLGADEQPLGMAPGHDGLPRLTAQSALIGAACPIPQPLPAAWSDFEGHPRPNLAEQRDRGADEWSQDAPLAPARSQDIGARGVAPLAPEGQ